MKIKIAIVDSRISATAERKLTLAGYRVFTLPPFSRLSAPVASHTDMLIHKIGNEYISYADYSEEAAGVFSDLSALILPTGAKFTLTSDEVSPEYPSDCRLNALSMGNKLFVRRDSASEYLTSRAEALGLEVVDTKQGYPACTVLKLGEDAAVTADPGMAKVLTEHGIRVTLITNGGIRLEPYEYGFIGGCGGVADGKIFFFGDVMTHPDKDLIISAARTEGLTIVSLDDGPLCDLGGIIFTEGYIQ